MPDELVLFALVSSSSTQSPCSDGDCEHLSSTCWRSIQSCCDCSDQVNLAVTVAINPAGTDGDMRRERPWQGEKGRGSESRRTREDKRHDWATWLLADEVKWQAGGGRRGAQLLLASARRSTGGATGRLLASAGRSTGSRTGRLLASAGRSTGTSRRRLGLCYGGRDGQESPAAEAVLLRWARRAGVAGGWRLELCCYGRRLEDLLLRRAAMAEGRSLPEGIKTSVFKLGVLWYFSPFSPGRRNPPATNKSEQREYMINKMKGVSIA